MRSWWGAKLALAGCLCAGSLWAQPREKPIVRPEDGGLEPIVIGNTDRNDERGREAALELPVAVAAPTASLVFHASRLREEGLLSEQIEDALKDLDDANGRATIVHLRAFVAGNGDMRRVRSMVLEKFEDKNWPLPALSTVQVGGFTQQGAQVVLEAVSRERNDDVNPVGIVFLRSQPAESVAAAIETLQRSAQNAQATVVRATCFLTSAAQLPEGQSRLAAVFPQAAVIAVQTTQYPFETGAQCEGVGRLQSASSVSGTVTTPHTIFTASQLVFRRTEDDVRAGYQRLLDGIAELGGSHQGVVAARAYTLSSQATEMASQIYTELMGSGAGVAQTALRIQGLPSYDATLAVELIAGSD